MVSAAAEVASAVMAVVVVMADVIGVAVLVDTRGTRASGVASFVSLIGSGCQASRRWMASGLSGACSEGSSISARSWEAPASVAGWAAGNSGPMKSSAGGRERSVTPILCSSKRAPHGPGDIHPRLGECHGLAARREARKGVAATARRTVRMVAGKRGRSVKREPE